MNKVIYFSAASSTKKIAKYASDYLDYDLVDLTSFSNRKSFDYSKEYNRLVICFPVYSQNIPKPVKEILKEIKTKSYLLIITYGRMDPGNVIYEASKIVKGSLVGASYVPTKHTFKDGEYFNNLEKLDNLFNKLKDSKTAPIYIERRTKNPFASFFPNFRSRISVEIKKTDKCIECGLCNLLCPMNVIDNGKISSGCIRCLRCYYSCPYGGLEVSYSKVLTEYLKNDKLDELIIYD